VGIKAGDVVYPPSQTMTLDISPAETLSVYGGSFEIRAPLSASGAFAPKPGDIVTVKIDYQGCNNTTCLRPASVSASIPLVMASKAGGATSGNDDDASGPGAIERAFNIHGWIWGFIAVFIGGMALNLTPCVYPLIGVTIAYFGNQPGGHRRVLSMALAYVLGIAITFSGVGVAVASSGGLFGAALQNPIVLAVIAALMLTLAASSFGWFVIQPPYWLMQRAGVARPGIAGAIVMGMGMGVVSAPCIGPIVLGLLLMVERSASALFGFSLFFTLAIGLGTPYVALALAAGSIRSLPRSGEWLAWVEQLFGFILTAMALYFLAPVIPNHLIERLWPYYIAGAAVYLGFISPAGRNWRPFFILRTGAGTIVVAIALSMIFANPAPAAIEFKPYNPDLLARASESKHPVLIDFSAAWCIPCREMERSTFIDPGVVREASRFVRLRADLTATDTANEKLTRQFDIQGVPTTLIIDSSGNVTVRKVGFIGARELSADLRRVD
jgi:thiol:disulfide interchange protein DsbD